MVVLSDHDIYRRLMTKEITIHPILDLKQIQGAKVDLRLGNMVYLIKHFEQPCYDPRDQGVEVPYGDERYMSFCRAEEKIRARFILQPGDFAIAPLFERVRLPPYILGRLDGRSSLGRLGIVVHATAGGIDPGYTGHITCELSNMGKVPVALHPLQRIASLTLEVISSDAVSTYRQKSDRKYVDQLATRLRRDKEFTSNILDMISDRL